MRGVEAYAAKHRNDEPQAEPEIASLNLQASAAKGNALLERKEYDRFRVAPIDPADAALQRTSSVLLKQIASRSDGRLTVEKFAESIEGRPIYLAKLGTGPKTDFAVVANARR